MTTNGQAQHPGPFVPEFFLIGGPEHGRQYAPKKSPPPPVLEISKKGAGQIIAAGRIPREGEAVGGPVVDKYHLIPVGLKAPGLTMQGHVYRWEGMRSNNAFGTALTGVVSEFLSRPLNGSEGGDEPKEPVGA